MELTKQEQLDIFEAKEGASVNIAKLSMDAPVIPLIMTAGGPPLIFSDDPEYIRLPQAGVMRETVRPGIFRLYTYHVNAVQGIRTRITNVIENLGSKPMTVRLLRQAFAKPTNEYNLAGCDGLKQYWTSQPEKEGRIVLPGQAIALDPKLENTLINYDDLAHGFYEVSVDQPARITALQTTADKSGPQANAEITKLEPIPAENNNAGRGFYPFSEYHAVTPEDYVLNTSNGCAQIVLADGITDRWVTGWSSDIEQPTILAGNYGLMYDITIRRAHDDGRSWALITWNQRSEDQWCGGIAMAMMVNGELISIPSDCIKITHAPQASVIKVFEPSEEPIHLIYSPPGASCLPIPLIFVPINK